MEPTGVAASPALIHYLNQLVKRYESTFFIEADPISIPLGFEHPEDQEIIGLYAALLAWGQRGTILKKMQELCERMGYQPSRFVRQFDPIRDASALEGFGHRTFRPDDAVNLTWALKKLLKDYGSLEAVFLAGLHADATDVGPAIQFFSESVMSAHPDTPRRLQKHLARPAAGSACKRLCMYLRWMVRSGPVDLGIWPGISPSMLILPLDVHSGRQARALGLLQRKANDWKAAVALTEACRTMDPYDPSRFDFALFGAGAFGEPLDPQFVTSTVS